MGILESYNRVAGHIQSQSELLAQIKTSLAGKAAGSGGPVLVTKTGTTTSTKIDTGLAEIVAIMLDAGSKTKTGLYMASHIPKLNAVQYTSCSYKSSNTSTISHVSNYTNPSQYVTVDEGTVTWKGTGTNGFISGVTYNWYAIGYE